MPNTMSPRPDTPRPEHSLAELATRWAGASRVFQRHQLDFCCQGQRSLGEACAQRGLDPRAVVAELQAEIAPVPAEPWSERTRAQLIAHLLERYHEGHRREVPRLWQMAQKVERVHGDQPECPRGLADHLARLGQELEQHMQKEEQVLFPMLLAGAAWSAAGPIQCMMAEHDEHGRNLARTRELAHDLVPPASACGTWRALYLGLAEFEREVMEHVHLENHVLFPKAIGDGSAVSRN